MAFDESTLDLISDLISSVSERLYSPLRDSFLVAYASRNA
jgi:hypothetical protein